MSTYVDQDKPKYANDLGILFFVTFIPWVVFVNLYTITEFQYSIDANVVSMILKITPFILLLREFINNKYSVREIIGYIVLVFMWITCIRSSNGLTVFDGLLFAFSARNLKFRHIIFTFFITGSILFIFTLGASYFQKIPDLIYINNGVKVRHSLGYTYTSFSSQVFFYLSCTYVFLRNKKISFAEGIIIELISIVLFLKTETRNPFLVTTLLVMFTLLIRYTNKDWKIIKKISIWIFPFLGIFSIIASYLFNPSSRMFSLLNTILSNRLELSNNALNQYGYAIFGQKIVINGVGYMGTYSKNYNVIDSSYVMNYVLRGPLFLMLILALFFLLLRKLCKSQYEASSYLILILVLMAMHSTLDPQLLSLWYNPFFLAIGYVFRRDFNLTNDALYLLK